MEEKFDDVIEETEVEDSKKSTIEQIKEDIIDFAKTAIVCLVFVLILTNFIVKPVTVEGDSMYPTLCNGSIGLMNIILEKTQDVYRGDIVVVYNENENECWVKRVIGIPGDTISCKDDVVFLNGHALVEDYLDQDYVKEQRALYGYFTTDFDEITLKEGEYWLMGDNRIVSRDSRSVGTFRRDQIIGKDIYVCFPFDQLKLARGANIE